MAKRKKVTEDATAVEAPVLSEREAYIIDLCSHNALTMTQIIEHLPGVPSNHVERTVYDLLARNLLVREHQFFSVPTPAKTDEEESTEG